MCDVALESPVYQSDVMRVPSRFSCRLLAGLGLVKTGPIIIAACLSLVACEDKRASPAAVQILSSAAYDSLPMWHVASALDACPAVEPQCHPTQYHSTASSANGWVVLVGETQKRLQLWRLGPGQTEFSPLGRAGRGPGEYGSVTSLSVDSMGNVMAFDLLHRHLLRYDTDGQPGAAQVVTLHDGFMRTDIAAGHLQMLATDSRRQSGDSARVSVFVLDSATFTRRATLPVNERDFGIDELRPIPDAFGPVPLWGMLTDGTILHSSATAHEVDVFDPSGRHVRRFGAVVASREIIPSDIEELVTRRLRGIGDERMRAAIRKRITVTPSGRHPALTRMVPLVNGEVWVRESHRAAGDSVSWAVYRIADGAALGRMMLGADDDILASVGDSLLFYRSDGPGGDAALEWITIAR